MGSRVMDSLIVDVRAMVFGMKEYKAESDEKVEVCNGLMFPRGERQFQIILCTSKQSFLWIGYMPRGIDLGEAVRMVIRETGKMETHKSRIVFLNTDKERALPLTSIDNRLVKSLSESETFLMITNILDLNEHEKTSDKAEVGDDLGDRDFLMGSDAQAA